MDDRNRKNDEVVQALVVANATVDETYSVKELPAIGESSVGQLRARDVGGKGANVATVLARCGLGTALVAVIGDDARGNYIKNELMQETIVLDLVQSTQCSTDISLINVDVHGHNTIVTTVEAAHSLEALHARQALERLPENGFLILQGNLTQALTRLLVSDAKKRGLTVVLNPSPLLPWMSSIVTLVDIVFVNEMEASCITGKNSEAAVTAMLCKGPSQVVLTRGAESALLGTRYDNAEATDQIHIESVPSINTDAVDTTGAGDTYLAVAMASAARRCVALDVLALTHAAQAAAHTISFHGARSAFPTGTELAAILVS
ncbi:MAG: PfkB family carbohydrate kinase [Granulosicoccus sp.]